MGQGQDRKDGGRKDVGERPQRQGVRRYLATLGCALLVTASFALFQGNPPAPGQPQVKPLFDKNNAWSHLMKQVSFGPRVPGSEAHIKCRDWIAEEMKKHCENVRLQEFTHKWSQTGKDVKMWNVIGEQNWKDAKVRLVLLAHWDTRPYADQEYDERKAATPITGANDGASGVAVLLELMKALKDRNKEVGILYLMTDGEDLGPGLEEMFLGAEHFAKNLPSPKPEYGILLDMIGDKDLRIPIEPNSYQAAPELIKAFYENAQKQGLTSTFPMRNGSEIWDDHLALIKAGIPTIDLIDFTYNPWHTLGDTPDKCSPESLWKVGIALETWLMKNPPWRKG